MQLNRNIVDELKTLKDDYLIKDIDEKLINSFLDIINDGNLFLKPVSFAYENANLSINMGDAFDYKIYGNIDRCLQFSIKMAKTFELNKENILLFIFIQLLHELTHIEQQELSWMNNNSLNELYRILISKDNIRTRVMYSIFRYRICYERNANINAFRENNKIFLSEINELNYLYHLFSYYYEISSSLVNAPVDDTFKIFGIKDHRDFADLSFIDIMEHGCSLNNQNVLKYYQLTSLYMNTSLSSLSMNDIYQKMLELR